MAYALGWKRPEKSDPLAPKFLIRNARRAGPTIDLSSGMGPQLDQGALGACGPATAAELINYDEKAQGLPLTSPSRLFMYYNARRAMGTIATDSGVINQLMLQAMAAFGWCPELMDPYDVANFTAEPAAECYNAATGNRSFTHGQVAVDLAQFQACLGTGRPFMFGFTVYSQIMSDQAADTGIVSMPSGSPIGGHDVSICGYTTIQQPGITPGCVWPANSFRFRNHWMKAPGVPWGDGGYGYIPFEYATSGAQASDCWVMSTVPGGGGGLTPHLIKPRDIIARIRAGTASAADVQALLSAVDQVVKDFKAQDVAAELADIAAIIAALS